MLLMIAAIVSMVVVINAVLPSVQRTSNDIVAASDVVGNRLRSDVKVIEAAGVDGNDVVLIWAKNVGAANIPQIDKLDVFFGPTANFERIGYDDTTDCVTPPVPPRPSPCWQYQIENDTKWSPYATVRLSLYLDYNLASGTEYVITIVLPNGITAKKIFSIS
jgi:hypothetical protein